MESGVFTIKYLGVPLSKLGELYRVNRELQKKTKRMTSTTNVLCGQDRAY